MITDQIASRSGKDFSSKS